MRKLSIRVKKRFPTIQHLVGAGLMTADEYDLYVRTVHAQIPNIDMYRYKKTDGPYGKWFLPTIWILNAAREKYRDKTIVFNELTYITNELMINRSGFDTLLLYDWVNIPLMYTQVELLLIDFYKLHHRSRKETRRKMSASIKNDFFIGCDDSRIRLFPIGIDCTAADVRRGIR
jgi:hypothetical protein